MSTLIDARRVGVDLDALIADDDEPAVAAITIAELGVGIEIAIIAATARANDRTVVTADRSGFDDLPGVILRGPP
jgi:predicted nucleic acid-binding protein